MKVAYTFQINVGQEKKGKKEEGSSVHEGTSVDFLEERTTVSFDDLENTLVGLFIIHNNKR